MSRSMSRQTRLLVVSVAINTAMIGVLIALLVGAEPPQRSEPLHGDFQMPSPRQLSGILGEAGQERLKTLKAGHRSAIRAEFRAVHLARAEVAAAVAATPYDAERLAQTLATLRHAQTRAAEQIHSMIFDLANGLDDHDRAALAAMIAPAKRPDESPSERP